MIWLNILIPCFTSLPCLSEKSYVTLCFSLEIGRSAMACFLISHSGYGTEVMIRVS